MTQTAKPVQLNPRTLEAFNAYIQHAETKMEETLRFEERDAGVVVECRAISLTRDVPLGLGWAIEPIIKKLPKKSLINTLEATRQALHARAR
jgi:hypothetical protein